MSEIVFLIDLVQDVAASRPIARFTRDQFGVPIRFIVSTQFLKRDATKLWFQELQDIANDLPAEIIVVDGTGPAVKALAGRTGALFSCCESALSAHAFNHSIFLAAPSGFTRITMQHGFECIGFNHNAAHDRAYQHFIGLACDIAASWFYPEALHSVRPDQRAKIMTVGPPFGLDRPMAGRPKPNKIPRRYTSLHGLVCENLHSVRFENNAKLAFVDAFASFADVLKAESGTLELRPHPGGRYVDKKAVTLPENARFNRIPLYNQALDRFTFGISSPSSVVLDMVWSGIPTAVWVGGNKDIDLSVYKGLHVVSDQKDWLDFARAATANPEPFLTRQATYLEALPIPRDITGRYRSLIALAAGLNFSTADESDCSQSHLIN